MTVKTPEIRVGASADKVLAAIRNPAIGLLAVAIVYGISQFLITDLRTFFGWDESVYFTEVSRFHESIGMAAHRSRGITLIVAPVALLTDSIVAVRTYLILMSSVALLLSFGVWIRLVRWGAVIAAALFATSWMTLFFGGQISPNLYSAFIVVAALGFAVRYLWMRSISSLWAYAILASAAAFIRPLDGVTLIAGAAVLSLILGLRINRAAVLGAAGALGLVVGVVPWVIEAWFRFDGPLQRLQRTRELVGGGLTNNFTEYLNLLDGPLVWTGTPEGVSTQAIVWLVAAVAFALVGAFTNSRLSRRTGQGVLLMSAFLALPYSVGADVAAPRFMLPALALLCLAGGIGFASVMNRNWGRLALIALVVLGVVWNAPVYTALAESHLAYGERVMALGEELRSRAPGGGCFFLSPSGHPQISVASGCQSHSFTGDPSLDNKRFQRAEAADLQLLALVPSNVAPQYSGTWRCEVVEGLRAGDWRVCEHQG